MARRRHLTGSGAVGVLIIAAWLMSGGAPAHADAKLRLTPLSTDAKPGMRLKPLSAQTTDLTFLPAPASGKPRRKGVEPIALSEPSREPPLRAPPPKPQNQTQGQALAKALSQPDTEIEIPVVVNDIVRGRVMMRVDGTTGNKSFDYKALRAVIADTLAPEVLAELDALASGRAYLSFAQTSAFKVPIRFDEEQLAVVVAVAPNYTRLQAFKVRGAGGSVNVPVARPADVSAFVNVRLAADIADSSSPAPGGNGLEPLRADLDGAINVKGWVVEGQADYLDTHDTPPDMVTGRRPAAWQRGNIRLVKDDVARMLRYAAGDLSYPVTGFQSYATMAGLSVARNFGLQPYNVFQPTGQTSIFLKSPSRVEVYINGNRDRILQLPAGNYSLSDFPVVDGVNDVHLLITDQTGRVEEHTLSIFTNDNLLKPGVHAFSFNIGLPSSVYGRRTSYGGDLTFSGFERYGVNDHWTIGANAQGNRFQQMAGVTSAYESAMGNIQLDLAASRRAPSQSDNGSSGTSGRLQYTYSDRRQHAFDMALSYRDADFQALGQTGQSAERYGLSMRYGEKIFGDIQASFGGRLTVRRATASGLPGGSQWAYSANFTKALSRALALNANFGKSSTDPFSVFLSLSWIPGRGAQTVTVNYDSLSDTTRADWGYATRTWGNNLSGSASLTRTGDARSELGGEIDYYNYRYVLSAQHSVAQTRLGAYGLDERRTQLRAATALVFADGKLAQSRPVSDSFALISAHDDLRDFDIGINPSQMGSHDVAFDAQVDHWGPGVLSDIQAYYERPLTIDIRHIPAGFDSGPTQYVLAPTYKSGIDVKVGTGKDAYVRGRVTYGDDQPLALAGGQVTGPDGTDTPVFTDRQGVFYVYGLARGTYRLTFIGHEEQDVTFKVDAAAGKMIDLGALALPRQTERVIRQ